MLARIGAMLLWSSVRMDVALVVWRLTAAVPTVGVDMATRPKDMKKKKVATRRENCMFA